MIVTEFPSVRFEFNHVGESTNPTNLKFEEKSQSIVLN